MTTPFISLPEAFLNAFQILINDYHIKIGLALNISGPKSKFNGRKETRSPGVVNIAQG